MDRRSQISRWLSRRELHGWTFRERARRSGLPVSTLSYWAWRLRREHSTRAEGRSPGPFVEIVEREQAAGAPMDWIWATGCG